MRQLKGIDVFYQKVPLFSSFINAKKIRDSIILYQQQNNSDPSPAPTYSTSISSSTSSLSSLTSSSSPPIVCKQNAARHITENAIETIIKTIIIANHSTTQEEGTHCTSVLLHLLYNQIVVINQKVAILITTILMP
jgi:hypothetical protein